MNRCTTIFMKDVNLTEYQNNLSIKNKIGRGLWAIVYWMMFRPLPGKLFNPWRIFLLRLFGAKFKGKVSVHNTALVWAPWNLFMDTTGLAEHVRCYNVAPIIICKWAVISQYAYLCTASHNINSSFHELITSPIRIESQAWVAADAFVGMGVTVGEGAVVGARSAVFKDVEPWTVVGGNPAKFIKKRIIKDA